MAALHSFVDLYRGNQSMEDFQSVHDLAWTDAREQGGFDMDDVGKTFFLLRSAQLSGRQLFVIRMRVDGDLSRYREIQQLLSRMYCDTKKTQAATVPAMAGTPVHFLGDVDGFYDAES